MLIGQSTIHTCYAMGHLLSAMVGTQLDEILQLPLWMVHASWIVLWNAGQLLWSGSVSLLRECRQEHDHWTPRRCWDDDYPILITYYCNHWWSHLPPYGSQTCSEPPWSSVHRFLYFIKTGQGLSHHFYMEIYLRNFCRGFPWISLRCLIYFDMFD